MNEVNELLSFGDSSPEAEKLAREAASFNPERWADEKTNDPPYDPKIPDGMDEKWRKLIGNGGQPDVGEVFNEIRDSLGKDTGITVVVRKIMGETCVYLTDHGGTVDSVYTISFREKPVKITAGRLTPGNCPQVKIEV